MKRKPLGRGLDALLPSFQEFDSTSVLEIDIDSIIQNRYQPREIFDDDKIQQLADSIKTNGIIQPLIVRRSKDKYELIVGERRLRAARIAKLEKIPAIIRELSDNKLLITALIENIQRDDLEPLEIAKAIKKLVLDYDLTHQQIAENIGKDRTTVTNYLRILNLPQQIMKSLEENTITFGHARALLSVEDTGTQIKICEEIIKKNLSVRQTEDFVRNILHKIATDKKRPIQKVDYFLKESEEILRKKLATK
ncbi:ParB/RepB/Spo0J family partition protein, partial [bacterium]|nr:ParB/RepB/Spo0J family partition protein [bacterium]